MPAGTFVRCAAIALIAICLPCVAQDRKLPDPSTFQTGDFLWPKVPGAIVPYDSRPGKADAKVKAQWNAERLAYLARIKVASQTDEELKRRYELLSSMTYEQFLITYLAGNGQSKDPIGDRGNLIYTGHVAIIEVVDGTPWVIDAVPPTLQRITYADWLAGRQDENVWHGRLKDAAPEERAKIAAVAKTEVGKPYDFWNFDLADEGGFYCSKLAWFSVYKSLNREIDGWGPIRLLWFSPKQMMHSDQSITILFSAGDY